MRTPILGVLMLSIAACGGGGSVTAETFDQEFVEAACTKAHQCRSTWPGEADEFTEIFGASASACISQNGGEELDAELAAALEAGTVIFDEDNANACLATLRDLGCDALWTFEEPDACDQLFIGTVAQGGACTIDEECIRDPAEDFEPYCSGTCMQF